MHVLVSMLHCYSIFTFRNKVITTQLNKQKGFLHAEYKNLFQIPSWLFAQLTIISKMCCFHVKGAYNRLHVYYFCGFRKDFSTHQQ